MEYTPFTEDMTDPIIFFALQVPPRLGSGRLVVETDSYSQQPS